jgi:hypothetical protein
MLDIGRVELLREPVAQPGDGGIEIAGIQRRADAGRERPCGAGAYWALAGCVESPATAAAPLVRNVRRFMQSSLWLKRGGPSAVTGASSRQGRKPVSSFFDIDESIFDDERRNVDGSSTELAKLSLKGSGRA